jgi:hypothetical protein
MEINKTLNQAMRKGKLIETPVKQTEKFLTLEIDFEINYLKGLE